MVCECRPDRPCSDFADGDSHVHAHTPLPPTPTDTPIPPTATPKANLPPNCVAASPSRMTIWPPDHRFVRVDELGVTDPECGPIVITIDSIFQDEPVDSRRDGSLGPDGYGVGSSTAAIQAERAASSNGRVYHIGFTASDSVGGSCSGELFVGVPKSWDGQDGPTDDGALYDSTLAAP